MIYVLGYPDFEPDCTARIAAFRARHEPERARLVPPHVTFVFGTPEKHLSSIADLVDQVSKRVQAFDISFNSHTVEFDPFERKHKLFLRCGIGRKRVIALHNQLYGGPHRSELRPEHRYRPHMTVATKEMRAEIVQVDISEIGAFPIKGRLHALDLIQLMDGKLITLKSAPLSG